MNNRMLKEKVALFPAQRVLIVGDVMLDEYIWGDVRRISPEAPVPVVEARRRTYVPGGAANVAINVASLGGRVAEAGGAGPCGGALGGVVGDDAQEVTLRAILDAQRVETQGLLVDIHRPTTTKMRIVAHTQQIVRVDSEAVSPLSTEMEEALLGWAEESVQDATACVLSDYGKGVVSPRVAQSLIRLARQAGKPIIVDPKGTDYSRYIGATVITPNVHEAQRAVNLDTGADVAEMGRRLLAMLIDSAVLITQGAGGMTLFVNGAPPVNIPAVARNVFDVTGAGDTVVGVLALALAAGSELEIAARLANMAGGIVVGKVGTATFSVDELLAAELDLRHE